MFSFKDYQPLENIVIKFRPHENVKEIPIFKINCNSNLIGNNCNL